MGLKDLMTGYGGFEFPLPDIAGQYKGKSVVVCGDAIGVWRDLEQFGCRSDRGCGRVEKEGWDFLTVNKLVETFPGNIEHCYSNAANLLPKWVDARRQEYTEFAAPKHMHSCNQGIQWRWPWGGHGTSGLGAILVAVGLGYERIVLCGMPLDDGPHNGEPFWRRTTFASTETAGPVGGGMDAAWKKAKQFAFEDKVRSMSGRTKEWLGAPVIAQSAFIHPKAEIDRATVVIGPGTRVWQFASVIRGTILGAGCNVAAGACLDGPHFGDRCIISQNVAMGPGFKFGDDVFVGPNVTVCNDMWPQVAKNGFDVDLLRDCARTGRWSVLVGNRVCIGANAVILPGVVLGDDCVVAAGAVADRRVQANHLLKRDGSVVPINPRWRERRMRAA
jgi:UDP-2-acetamido-3-amino-2,3-dideoxy-glucuronate N-acetyltransferase